MLKLSVLLHQDKHCTRIGPLSRYNNNSSL